MCSIVGQNPYEGGKGRCGKLLEELFLLGRGGIIWGQDNRKTVGSRGRGHGKINTQKGRNKVHWIKNPIYVFPEMKLCGLVPNSYIHIFVRD